MLLGTRSRRLRLVTVVTAIAAVALVLLSGFALAVNSSSVGSFGRSHDFQTNQNAADRLNLGATASSLPASFNPSTLAQSTFSFLNDTLLPGNGELSPTITSGTVAAASGVDEILAGTRNSLIAMNATDGSMLWQVPSLGEDVEYVAVDPTGAVGFAVLSGQYTEIVKVGLATGTILAHTYDATPSPIAFDPVNQLLYQTEIGNLFVNELAAYYSSNLTPAASLPSYSGGNFNPSPTDIAIDPVTGNVYVTSNNGFGQIVIAPNAGFAVLSALNGSILNESYVCGPGTSGPSTHAVAIDSQNKTVFVLCTNQTATSLYVQSAITAQTVAIVPLALGWMPWWYGENNALLYVPQTNSIAIGNAEGGLTLVNATSYRITANTAATLDDGANVVLVQGGPDNFVYGVNPYANEIFAFDASIATREFSRQFAPMPITSTLVDQRGDLWVAGAPNAESLSVLNTTLGRVVGSVVVGLLPDAIAYDASHDEIWVANALSDNVSVVDAVTERVVATVPVDSDPVGLVVAPSFGEVFVSEEAGYLSGSYSSSAALTAINDTTFAVEGTVNLSAPQNVYPTSVLPTTIAWDANASRIIVGDEYGFWINPSSPSIGFWSIDPAHFVPSASPIPLEAGYSPFGLGYDDATGNLYASGWLTSTSANETVWRVNPSNGASEGSVGILSSNLQTWPADSLTGAYSPSIVPLSGTPWMGVVEYNGSGARVAFFNVSAPGFNVASYPLGRGPLGLEWSPKAGEVYVENYESDSISWFDSSPRVTVKLNSTVVCGDYPEIDGTAVGRSVLVPAPGQFSIKATEFCGSSVFYSWITAGGAAVTPDSASYGNSGTLEVSGAGEVTANYLTEPAGVFPLVFQETGLPKNTTWTVTAGSVPGIANDSTIYIGVPNGTYHLSFAKVLGYVLAGAPQSLIVNGTGIWVNVTFTGTVSKSGGWPGASEYPLVVAFVAFAIGGSMMAVVIRARSRSRQVAAVE